MAAFGVDVAEKRADDLDRKCIEIIKTLNNPKVLDLGCGAGGQSKRMAEVGALVTAVDISNYGQALRAVEGVTFYQGDIRNFSEVIQDKSYDLCVLQRTIHYLKHDEALTLLRQIKSVLNGPLCISVTGIDSDIGDHYPAKDQHITGRYAALDIAGQELFSISEPVCLYTPEEFNSLLISAGFSIDECWISAFQNIKVVCH